MGVVRGVGSTIGGLAFGLVFLAVVLLVEIGGITYRKDCLTNRGTVTQSWTVTWYAPLPFLFRPSETGCVVHVGTRVALNAIGIDTFSPSTADAIAGHQVNVSGDQYWPRVRAAMLELEAVPQTADLTSHLAALTKARDTVQGLDPSPAYAVANEQLVVALSALVAAGHRLQHALLQGDGRAEAAVLGSQKQLVSSLAAAATNLDRIHSAQ